MVTRDVAKAVLEEVRKSGKSISSIAVSMGHPPGSVHSAISRLRREQGSAWNGTSQQDPEETSEVAAADSPKALLDVKKRPGRPPGKLNQGNTDKPADEVKVFSLGLQKKFLKAAESNPEIAFALGFASSLVGLARENK